MKFKISLREPAFILPIQLVMKLRLLKRSFLCLVLMFLSTVVNSSSAQYQFAITLNFEQHHGKVKQIAGNPNASFFITTSEDGTARVWDTSNLKLKKIIRAPLEKGEIRVWESAAISPDNQLIALGLSSKGSSHEIYFFDGNNFELKDQLQLKGAAPRSLRFSPDSKKIFVGFAANEIAIQSFDIKTRKMIDNFSWGKSSYFDVETFEISPDGNYLALPSPTRIYLLKRNSKTWAALTSIYENFHSSANMISFPVFAFSPNGDLAATFREGMGVIQIFRKSSDYKKRSLMFDACEDVVSSTEKKVEVCYLKNLRSYGQASAVTTMKWDADGEKLFLGYGFSTYVRRLDLGNLLRAETTKSSENPPPSFDIKINGNATNLITFNNKTVIATTSPKWPPNFTLKQTGGPSNGLVKLDENKIILEASPIDLTDSLYSGSFPSKNEDGKYSCSSKGQIVLDPTHSQLIFPPKTCTWSSLNFLIGSAELKVGGRIKTEDEPRSVGDYVFDSKGEKRNLSTTFEKGNSSSTADPFAKIYAATKFDSKIEEEQLKAYPTPDHKHLIVVSPQRIQLISNAGIRQWEFLVRAGVKWVNFSADGSLVVFAMSDGTNRIHKMASGINLMNMVIDQHANRWVVWTPSGYYTASPGAEDWFGFLVQKENQKFPDLVPASRFRDTLYRPDIIEKILPTQDEAQSIASANEKQGIRPNTKTTNFTPISQLPPVLDLLSNIETEANTPTTKLRVRVRTSENSP
ncbi:WD40 repeat domain-containing protein, partial [Undibacterium sp. Di24W]|uniref:WD40 repeat domain-containing protein n=1 Tax=Undibacterium sp. Di24W TaxID=3413033 RepID=UPI003BF3C1F7